jgi:CDP-paratose 2-epimerase
MNILITGGAGFIGANCARFFADRKHRVVVFDDLSRMGSDRNSQWLTTTSSAQFIKGDVRKFDDLKNAIVAKGPFDMVLHLAAQVAVTNSFINPRDDFERNAYGAFNLLEAVRLYNPNAVVIYASTNKVYGGMDNLKIVERNGRYDFDALPGGVNEQRNMDFHSPYGCSKGTADQYFRDYARMYGLKTVVMRQSCIYGYRQFGVEDQGWVTWFCIAAMLSRPITIYGDGKQVRDVLFIDDLVRLYELTCNNIDKVAGGVFNIGGGPANTLSLHELIALLEEIQGRKISLAYKGWRRGDQKVFIADISLVEKKLGWMPAINPSKGVTMLYNWVKDNKLLFT